MGKNSWILKRLPFFASSCSYSMCAFHSNNNHLHSFNYVFPLSVCTNSFIRCVCFFRNVSWKLLQLFNDEVFLCGRFWWFFISSISSLLEPFAPVLHDEYEIGFFIYQRSVYLYTFVGRLNALTYAIYLKCGCLQQQQQQYTYTCYYCSVFFVLSGLSCFYLFCRFHPDARPECWLLQLHVFLSSSSFVSSEFSECCFCLLRFHRQVNKSAKENRLHKINSNHNSNFHSKFPQNKLFICANISLFLALCFFFF